jgi:hypothetical protein
MHGCSPLIQKSDVSESPVIALPSPTVKRSLLRRATVASDASKQETDRRRAHFSCVVIFVPRESTQHGDYRCPFLEHASWAARPTLQWSPFGFEIQSEEVSLLLAGDQRFLLASSLSLSRCIGPEVDQRGQSRCVCDGDPFARGPRTPGLDMMCRSVWWGTHATRLAVLLQQRLPSPSKPRCSTPRRDGASSTTQWTFLRATSAGFMCARRDILCRDSSLKYERSLLHVAQQSPQTRILSETTNPRGVGAGPELEPFLASRLWRRGGANDFRDAFSTTLLPCNAEAVFSALLFAVSIDAYAPWARHQLDRSEASLVMRQGPLSVRCYRSRR